MIFWVMNRWGQQKDCIGDVVEAIHKDEVNGEDSLTLVLTENRLIKGDRVVWKDRFGDWHEHIANEATRTHSDGALLFQFYCENSIAETMGDYVEEITMEGTKAANALPSILSGSRWSKGTVDDFGLGDFYLFNSMAYDGIRKAHEIWGGEISTRITVSGDSVSQRLIDMKARRGHDDGKLFTYGHDMSAIEQTVSADDVVTRLHVFGKGTGNGDADAGYTERLTFESINNGKDYVEDNDAKLVWGLPDGNGGVKHAEGVVIFEDCEDETELLSLGNDELDKRKHPHVSYRATVATLSDYGYDYEDARPGDTVYLRDEPLDLRLEGRVTCITRYLVNMAATVVELGDTIRSITDVMSLQAADLQWLRSRSGGWDAASLSNAAWLDRFIDNLNAQFDAAGGYVNIDPEKGITVVDNPTNPTMAIQINGMGFRIANQKNSNGTWKWRTMGTGNGLVADEIVTGVLHCGTNSFDLTNGTITLANGLIQDSQSANYWNLATGEMRLASTITVGGSTVSNIASTAASGALTSAKTYADGKDTALETSLKNYADSVSAGQLSASKTYAENQDAALLASLTQAEVLKRLTNNGAAQGIYMTNGQLYINGSYINTGTIDAGIIRAGILIDSQSNNYWNLATGYLSTTSGSIGGFTIGQSAIYNGLSSLTGQTEGIYLGTNGIACATSYDETDENNNTTTHSHSIAFSGGGMEGRYDGSVVGYITPNATATGTDANNNPVTLHGLQMRGGVIDLRTAHLTVYDANSASGSSTHTITEMDESIATNPYYGTRITPASYTNDIFSAYFKYTYPKFINGLYVGQAMKNYTGFGNNAINFATKEYVDALATRVAALEGAGYATQTWVDQQGYLTSVPSHSHSYTSNEITNKPSIPSFSWDNTNNILYITGVS